MDEREKAARLELLSFQLGEIERALVRVARQARAREPAVEVVPQHERALLVTPLPHEPADDERAPRKDDERDDEHRLPRCDVVEPPVAE